MSRQLAYADEEPEDEDVFNHGHPLAGVATAHVHEDHPDYSISSLARLTLEEPYSIGFNGRLNKPADTCYSWWGAASLEVCYPSIDTQNKAIKFKLTYQDSRTRQTYQ
jgi:hypothetical protein